MTALKLALIGGVIVAGLSSEPRKRREFPDLGCRQIRAESPGFFVALVAALWAYDGWNNAGMLGSEIERPERICRGLDRRDAGDNRRIYLLTNLTYFYVLSAPEVGCQRAGRGRCDAPGAGTAGRRSGQHRRHDFDFRGAERIHSFRLARSLCHGAGWIFLSNRSPRFIRRFRTPRPAIVLLGVWSSLVLAQRAISANCTRWSFFRAGFCME